MLLLNMYHFIHFNIGFVFSIPFSQYARRRTQNESNWLCFFKSCSFLQSMPHSTSSGRALSPFGCAQDKLRRRVTKEQRYGCHCEARRAVAISCTISKKPSFRLWSALFGFVFSPPKTAHFSRNHLHNRYLHSFWPFENWLCFFKTSFLDTDSHRLTPDQSTLRKRLLCDFWNVHLVYPVLYTLYSIC